MSEAIGLRSLITSGTGIPTRGAYKGSTDQDQYWWTEDQAIRISPVLTYPWTVLDQSTTVYEPSVPVTVSLLRTSYVAAIHHQFDDL